MSNNIQFLDGAAVLLLCVYIITVYNQSNESALWAQFATDLPGFAKWGVSILVLLAFASVKELRPFFAPILGIAFMALFLSQGQLILKGWSQIEQVL